MRTDSEMQYALNVEGNFAKAALGVMGADILQFNPNQAIAKKATQIAIAQSVANGDCLTPDDVAVRFKLPVEDVVLLFNDDNYLAYQTMFTQAKLNVAYNGTAVNRLVKIIDGDDDRLAMQAINMLAKLTGKMKSGFSDLAEPLEELLDKIDEKAKAALGTEEKIVNPKKADVYDLFKGEEGFEIGDKEEW